jgi:hypothetical protein
MIGAHEFFERFIDSNSNLHLQLDMGTKHAVNASRTIPFQKESGGVLRVANLLWVP